MRVRIYYNLKKAVWSVLAMEGPLKGRVVAHAKGVCLTEARTIVSKAGRERVLREKQKNVHAYIEGELQAIQSPHMRYYEARIAEYVPVVSDVEQMVPGHYGELRYNPYKAAHFYWDHNGESSEHHDLDRVVMTAGRKVYAPSERLY